MAFCLLYVSTMTFCLLCTFTGACCSSTCLYWVIMFIICLYNDICLLCTFIAVSCLLCTSIRVSRLLFASIRTSRLQCTSRRLLIYCVSLQGPFVLFVLIRSIKIFLYSPISKNYVFELIGLPCFRSVLDSFTNCVTPPTRHRVSSEGSFFFFFLHV